MAIVAIVLAVVLLTSSAKPPANIQPTAEPTSEPTEAPTPTPAETPEITIEPVEQAPIKTYDDGIASFAYDSTKLAFDEVMADNTDGIPLTSFLMIDPGESLPRLDVFPLTLDAPFSTDTTEDEFKNLVGALVISYFEKEQQDQVGIKFDTAIMNIEESTASMEISFSSILSTDIDKNMTGIAKLISDENHALIMIALTKEGNTIPTELTDVIKSAELYFVESRV